MLTAGEKRRARRFLEAHPPPGRLLQCGVTGAHAYGFPSPDSDVDLEGVHLAPTAALLDEARASSPLPEDPTSRDAIHDWLVALRLRSLK